MILVSGFKPFLSEKINPSELLIKYLENKFPEIKTIVLPVEFETAYLVLQQQIKLYQPQFVIMLGQAGGRAQISLEKVALNWNQTHSPDESGVTSKPAKIKADLDLAYMTEFPIDEVYQSLKAQNYPVEISFSAGTYVCNNLYFKTLTGYPKIKSVFIHVPFLPEQGQDIQPKMDFDVMCTIVEKVIAKIK